MTSASNPHPLVIPSKKEEVSAAEWHSLINPGIVNTLKQQTAQVTRGMGGALAWPGLLRKLDRIDSGFRQ